MGWAHEESQEATLWQTIAGRGRGAGGPQPPQPEVLEWRPRWPQQPPPPPQPASARELGPLGARGSGSIRFAVLPLAASGGRRAASK